MLETGGAVIRVLIADDHPADAQGAGRHPRPGSRASRWSGAAEDGAAAIALAYAVKPDIVLMDISMPGMDGIEATEKLVEMDSDARVVMLTSYSEREKITQALAAGAVSYLTKDAPPEAVIRAIHRRPAPPMRTDRLSRPRGLGPWSQMPVARPVTRLGASAS